MPFNSSVKKLIVRDKCGERLPCVMCGKTYPLPDAVHIVDEKEWKAKLTQDSKINGIPLCPNCHRVFDEVLRPYLFRALKKFGTTSLPNCWKKSNKLSVTEQDIDLDSDES